MRLSVYAFMRLCVRVRVGVWEGEKQALPIRAYSTTLPNSVMLWIKCWLSVVAFAFWLM